jgi:hypothetical protein
MVLLPKPAAATAVLLELLLMLCSDNTSSAAEAKLLAQLSSATLPVSVSDPP